MEAYESDVRRKKRKEKRRTNFDVSSSFFVNTSYAVDEAEEAYLSNPPVLPRLFTEQLMRDDYHERRDVIDTLKKGYQTLIDTGGDHVHMGANIAEHELLNSQRNAQLSALKSALFSDIRTLYSKQRSKQPYGGSMYPTNNRLVHSKASKAEYLERIRDDFEHDPLDLTSDL